MFSWRVFSDQKKTAPKREKHLPLPREVDFLRLHKKDGGKDFPIVRRGSHCERSAAIRFLRSL